MHDFFDIKSNAVILVISAILLLIAVVVMILFISYFQLWIQARLTRSSIGFIDLISAALTVWALASEAGRR